MVVSSWPFWKKWCLTDLGNTESRIYRILGNNLYRIFCALPFPSLLPDLSLTREDFSQLVHWFWDRKWFWVKSAALIIAVSFKTCAMTSGLFQLAKSSVEGKIPVPVHGCWSSKCFSVSWFRKKQSHPRKSGETRQRCLLPSGARQPRALQPRLCPALLCRASCPLECNSSSWDFSSVLIVRVEEKLQCYWGDMRFVLSYFIFPQLRTTVCLNNGVYVLTPHTR